MGKYGSRLPVKDIIFVTSRVTPGFNISHVVIGGGQKDSTVCYCLNAAAHNHSRTCINSVSVGGGSPLAQRGILKTGTVISLAQPVHDYGLAGPESQSPLKREDRFIKGITVVRVYAYAEFGCRVYSVDILAAGNIGTPLSVGLTGVGALSSEKRWKQKQRRGQG